MPDWTNVASVALNVIVMVAGLAYGFGIWRERVAAKDILRRVSDLEDWEERFTQDTEERFDRASGLMSKLTSKIQDLPAEIEARVEKRYYEAGVAKAEIAALDRRIHMVEDRMTLHNGKAHDR